jgi:hypothetical protein
LIGVYVGGGKTYGPSDDGNDEKSITKDQFGPYWKAWHILDEKFVEAASSTPGSARIFDSFSREDSTWAFQNSPGLGSTEAGSLGALSWTQKTVANATPTNGAIFGVQGGRAVVIWAEPSPPPFCCSKTTKMSKIARIS